MLSLTTIFSVLVQAARVLYIKYSLEGFTDSEVNPPVIRFIDVVQKKQDRLYYAQKNLLVVHLQQI